MLRCPQAHPSTSWAASWAMSTACARRRSDTASSTSRAAVLMHESRHWRALQRRQLFLLASLILLCHRRATTLACFHPPFYSHPPALSARSPPSPRSALRCGLCISLGTPLSVHASRSFKARAPEQSRPPSKYSSRHKIMRASTLTSPWVRSCWVRWPWCGGRRRGIRFRCLAFSLPSC